MSESTAAPAPDATGTGSAPAASSTTTETAASIPVVDMPSYEGDVSAMREHTNFLDTVVLPHFEGLINAAHRAGMGPGQIASLSEGQEAIVMARTSVANATDKVVLLNEAVARAHADARDAATAKSYYAGE
ncbi:hypothetical protein ABZ234_07800 [Nocardiopsis sp. NPDC006198]|uniref:hypothetical protein n=1 Tax=Nocardiopsis sp. NPDC006198 TaxID=3154472 RepID=UPI0033A3475D